MDYAVEGTYRSGRYSGLIAGVVAGSATNGHLWAARLSIPAATQLTDKRRFAVIQRVLVKANTVTGYTNAQEVQLALYKLTSYTVAHSGGTGAVALTPTKKRADVPAALLTGRMAGSDQLTAGTQTIDTDSIGAMSWTELATGAAVPKGLGGVILMSTEDLIQHPLVLQDGEGLLVRNEVAQGAAGTMRLTVEIDWLETQRYPIGTYNVAKAVI